MGVCVEITFTYSFIYTLTYSCTHSLGLLSVSRVSIKNSNEKTKEKNNNNKYSTKAILTSIEDFSTITYPSPSPKTHAQDV